ncbi:MAG: beta-ketoacyl-[acyl-carrier-protein] synthase family protein, partial [Enterobacterales bacterium]|nr:beta-ketoacyl-[acyl-carrier-protein] synthase family protein [Enterobacterales bacterium]
MQRNNEMRRVVVTGYGAITPLGSNAQASWQAIMDYQLGYGYVDKTELGIKAHFLGLIAEEPSLKGVPAA